MHSSVSFLRVVVRRAVVVVVVVVVVAAVLAAVVVSLLLVANMTFLPLQRTLLMLVLAAAEAENCMAKTGGKVELLVAVAVAATEGMAQTE